MVELRRVIVDPSWDTPTKALATVVNRLVARDRGDKGGRLWLLGDDGDQKAIQGGAVLSSTNYPLRVRSAIANHVQVTHSSGAPDLLRIQDSGITLSSATVTGNVTVGGSLAVTGQTTLTGPLVANGAVTLGDAAADVITIKGATTMQSTLAVTGATTLTGALAANGGITTTTLAASGAATLNGAVTLGDNVADVITVAGTMSVAEDLTLAKGLIVDTSTLVVDETTDRVGMGTASPACRVDVLGAIRVGGTVSFPATGSGLELFMNGGITSVQGFDRGGGAYLPVAVNGSAVRLQSGGTTTFEVNGTGVGFYGTSPVSRPSTGSASTDLATVIALANALRTGLRALGLFN